MTTNFFAPVLRWVCEYRGHRWSKPFIEDNEPALRVKVCKRCSLVREVKTRAKRG